MDYKCVCSDCGEEIHVTKTDSGFSPEVCPACKGKILKITHTATATDYVAWVKEEE